jgi:hypothetical protein
MQTYSSIFPKSMVNLNIDKSYHSKIGFLTPEYLVWIL